MKNGAESEPRLVCVLMGDVKNKPDARTKYSYLVQALERQFTSVISYDAELHGWSRIINAFLTMHPNIDHWRERLKKNEFAFRARSRRVAAYLKSPQHQANVVLQVGVLFDANWNNSALPNVIYTDYTARLSARKPGAGRSPFNTRQLERWLALERQAYERAIHICTRSNFVKDSIVNDYNIPAERITIVGGGINFKNLPEIEPKADNNQPTILFIGRDFYRKGGDLVLHAFAQVRAQIPEARLLFSTKGPIPKDLPLAGVELIPADWDRAMIKELYGQADLFVLPSRLETWGDVLLEAMAYEVPCIGVWDEAMREIIEDEITGLLVPPEDIEALAKAMTRLLSDRSLCYQFGQAARHRVVQKYTWDCVVDRLRPAITAGTALSLSRAKKEQKPISA